MTTAETPTVLVEQADNGVATLTLNRPERLNAYSPQMSRELVAAFDWYLEHDEVRALVVTGAGRGFCAGGDISGDIAAFAAVRATQLGEARSLRQDWHAVMRRLYKLDKPVIAAVNGVAVSGGLTLALLCDVRLAAATARFGETSGRAGMLPDEGAAWLLPRLVGYDKAWLMVMSHDLVDAEQALDWGLVTRVVPDDELLGTAMALAGKIARGAPIAQRLAKRLLRSADELSFDAALDAAGIAAHIAIHTSDAAEGKTAFREKRPPEFTGH